LEALTVLCHFCLLDTGQPFNHPLDHNSTANSNTPAQLFNNLVHVFIPSPLLAVSSNNALLVNIFFLLILYTRINFKASRSIV